MFFTLVGCSKKKEVEDVKKKDDFEIKMAINTIDKYMDSIEKEKYEELNKLLTEDVKSSEKDLKINELKIRGYKLDEITETDREGIFKINVIKSNINKPETLLIESIINVVKDGTDYKISKISNSMKKEVFYLYGELRIRNENKVDTNLVINMEGVPKYAYSKDDKAKMEMQLVPKKNFGAIDFSYEGDKLAFTTVDNDVFIAILTLDETMQTQGESQGKEAKDEKEGKLIREKPIGKQIVACDFLRNCKIEGMFFSEDERYLIVQYKTTDNKMCIRIYNCDSGELVPIKFEEEYPLNKVGVKFLKLKKDKMIYQVNPVKQEYKDNEYIGMWELDFKEFKPKRIEK
ncbi:hypothetical protein OW763_15275 [Clostridium aestuarii]|uniref:Lipoprotein n=2 Tax=Clostridium aestuarii TaxID=338193 RepID=A0ABT4D690_9CLOT|nr:hypothetical protein [Clostridium aestuarii]